MFWALKTGFEHLKNDIQGDKNNVQSVYKEGNLDDSYIEQNLTRY